MLLAVGIANRNIPLLQELLIKKVKDKFDLRKKLKVFLIDRNNKLSL